MDLEPSPEQVALRGTVARLLADHAPIGVAARAVVEGAAWEPDRAWSELEAIGAMDLLGAGAGSGVVEAAIVAEELGRACYPGPWATAVAGDDADVRAVLLGADALGAASAALGCAVEHAKVRHQFGKPIGSFQAVAHLCVDMLETVELVRGTVLHAAWALDAGDPDAHRAVLRVRASAERLLAVAETAIQVLGGIGYTWEHDAHLWLRRLLAWVEHAAPAAARRELAGQLAG